MRESKGNGGPVVAPESVWSAMVHVYDTGQRLVLERIELAKLELIGFARGELQVMARKLARNLVLGLAGGILLLGGWFVLSWGLVNVAASALSMAWRLVIDAGLNLILGGVLVWLASRETSSPPPELEPSKTPPTAAQ